MPQIGFKAKISTKDVVQISKKFEDLPVKKQRQILFETFNNSLNFSPETIRNLMKFKDKSIPLIKELYEITKNDELFTGGLVFYDMEEEDLPARIEFYKKYKEEQHVTINNNLNVLCHINRYNLPLAKLIGLNRCYSDDEIKLVQSTLTKETADARIMGYKTLKDAIFEESLSHKWNPSDLYKILSNVKKCHLPLLKRMCGNKNYLNDPRNILGVLNRTDKNNIEAKIKIFDLMDEIDSEGNDVSVLKYTDNENYELVEYLLEDDEFPRDYIKKVAYNVEAKDCEPKIDIYIGLNKRDFSGIKRDSWNLIAEIIKETHLHNSDLAKALLEDRYINLERIPAILEFARTKDLADIKLNAYNTLKYRIDAINHYDDLADIIKNIGHDEADVFNSLESNPKFNIKNISGILSHHTNSKEKQSLFLRLINNKEMTGDDIQEIISALLSYNLKIAEKVCFDSDFSTQEKIDFLNSTFLSNDYENFKYCDFLYELDLKKLHDNYKKIRQTALNNPEMYINGNEYDYNEMVEKIDAFFNRNMAGIMGASHIFDLKTMDDLLRMRLDYAEDYLEEFANTDIEDLKLLKSLCDAKGVDGKPLSSKQKIEMLDLLDAYYDNGMPLSKIEEMAEKGIVNVDELNENLLRKIFANMEIDVSDIPKEQLQRWDLRYIHLLAQVLKDSDCDSKELFETIISIANSKVCFKDFIQDTDFSFGILNESTKQDFLEMNMNYDRWVNPDKKNNVHFVHKDENKEKLTQISDQIEEDINTLLHSMDEVVKSFDKNPIRKILYNSFGEYMVREGYGETSDRFVIPKNVRGSKANLTALVTLLSDTSKEGVFTTVWNRANQNLNNPNNRERAAQTLMIMNHLKQRLKDLEKADRVKNRNLDLTIKMWDRIPQHDLFQGNYSTCCIGMNECNGWSIPVYLLHTAFNMIELVDNATGETVGNALCYFVKDADTNEPVFIIDNIEVHNKVKPSDEVGKKLRAAITEYAKNITKDVTEKDNIRILLGTSFNDVPDKDLLKIGMNLFPFGTLEDEVYTDAIDYDTESGCSTSDYEVLYRLA